VIELLMAGGRTGPVCTCDWCGERIRAAADGNALWFLTADYQIDRQATAYTRGGEAKTGELFLTHKCCYAGWRRRNEDAVGRFAMSAELAAHIVFLTQNVAIDWKRARAVAKMTAEIM